MRGDRVKKYRDGRTQFTSLYPRDRDALAPRRGGI